MNLKSTFKTIQRIGTKNVHR